MSVRISKTSSGHNPEQKRTSQNLYLDVYPCKTSRRELSYQSPVLVSHDVTVNPHSMSPDVTWFTAEPHKSTSMAVNLLLGTWRIGRSELWGFHALAAARAHHNVWTLHRAPNTDSICFMPNAKQFNRTEPFRFSTLIICRILTTYLGVLSGSFSFSNQSLLHLQRLRLD